MGLTELSPEEVAGSKRARWPLSVCCMTSGRRPDLLGGVLAPFREIADEIVVAVVAERLDAVRPAVAGVADRLLSFPAAAPADRPIAWLFRACRGRWIFNVDDDEVPSPALAGRLPELARREDVTHMWVARRWLHPTVETYIGAAPWGTEFQLRLVLADDRFLQFSDEFHRPVVCHGPSAYVEEPLWHLDTVLNPAARRRSKAAAYERERPGMRFAGRAHNLGLYVPELEPELALTPVPEVDRAAIAAALGFRADAFAAEPEILDSCADEVDHHWSGPPYSASLYQARLELVDVPPTFVAGVQQTVDVRVANLGLSTWRWGSDARPAVRLGYRWWSGSEEVRERAALRTALPADVPPGRTAVVPVHVVAPAGAGAYELELDLLHDDVRWFGVGASRPVRVRARRRLPAIAPPERLPEVAAGLAPDVEPVALLRDEADRPAYGDYTTVVALRPYLLAGTRGRSRPRILAMLLGRTIAICRKGNRWSYPGYSSLLVLRSESEALLVDAPNWELGAAFGREWAWVAATALLWRLDGKSVLVREEGLPHGNGFRDRAVRVALRALRSDARRT
jgi:hypothetical protein